MTPHHSSDHPSDPTDRTDPTDPSALHQAYVNQLQRAGHLRTPLIEAAFRAVPRHLFVPGFPLEEVYSDRAINIEPGASSSQPAV